MDLLRQFARRRDDQRERRPGGRQMVAAREQRLGKGETVAHGLAGAGLGRDQQIASGLGGQNFGLNGGGFGIAARFKRARQSSVQGREGHSGSGIQRGCEGAA